MEHSLGHGKWAISGVPHRGWPLPGVHDVANGQACCEESDMRTCEMCESARIRYVHIVEHDNYADRLEVGCICCENLTGDYAGPRRQEAELRKRIARRARWMTRGWRLSQAGNPMLKHRGFKLSLCAETAATGCGLKHRTPGAALRHHAALVN
jgi:hypothetical protein